MRIPGFFVVFLLLVLSYPTAASDLTAAIEAQLNSPPVGAVHDAAADDLAIVRAFYIDRDYAPIWVAKGGARPRAAALQAILADAAADGLDPDDYGAAAILALGGASKTGYLAELEVRLSLGLVRFVADLGAGRLRPQRVDPELYVYPDDVDRLAALRQAAASDDIAALVARYRPGHREYDRLRAALPRLRAQAAAEPDIVVPPGRALRSDKRDTRVPALRARLVQLGDATVNDDPANADLFDGALEAAVRRFQARHGLDVDGVVGRETLAALNVPLAMRVRQLLLNMERWRWMPDDFGPRHIVVNLADYTLEFYDGAAVGFRTRVIVGALYHRTPVFSEAMRYLDINPYWNVPDRIAGKELLPKIKRDPGFLASEHMTVLSGWGNDATVVDPATVDWSKLSARHFPYRLRQEPGPDNALGAIKFMLPNRFNVYLHDTPTKGLFAKARRNFSHGCIRVEAPEVLAGHVLAGHDGWSEARVREVIASGKQVRLPLQTPVPVYITYLTARVGEDGRLDFRDDPYGRDAILAEALLGPRASTN